MLKRQANHFLNISLFIIVSFILFYVLYIGASLIIPFIIAILFSFAIIGLSNFYRKFRLPTFITFVLSIATYIFIFWLIGAMIGSNVAELNKSLPEYQEKIFAILRSFLDYLPESMQTKLLSSLSDIDMASIFGGLVDTVTSIFSSAGIILFYVMFILLEYRFFKEKLNLIITDNSRKKEVFGIIGKIKDDIKMYFVIKTLVSLGVGVLSYFIMLGFGLNFAAFWAFLIFILNFIPYIGSIIAVSFPVMFSLIEFGGNIYTTTLLLSLLIGIQVFMGNIVEPKFMGNKLNLSPLVILVSLGFWGAMWGVLGMILSIPITVIMNIILGKIPATKPIAILLSEKGDLQIHDGDEVEEIRKKFLRKIRNRFRKRK